MSKLPVISYRNLAKKLRKANYTLIRTSKHPIYYNAEKDITIPVPMHSGDVPKGMLRALLQQMEMSIEEFINL